MLTVLPKKRSILKLKRQKIVKERYYVYMLTVGNNIFYYGITGDLSKRLKSHKTAIQKLIDTGNYKLLPSETKCLKVHHKMASKLMRSGKFNRNVCRVNMSTCYVTDCLDDAKEVELFLIKKAKKKGLCCNTKETL